VVTANRLVLVRQRGEVCDGESMMTGSELGLTSWFSLSIHWG
jgi:hypothetical protein